MGRVSGMVSPVGWKLPTLIAMMWVIVLSVAAALVGALIAGTGGLLIGAMLLALGTILAGYVPSIREAVRRREDELQRLEDEAAAAQGRWDAVGEPAVEAVDCGPAVLLRADRTTVAFTGRETELSSLRAWCASEDARSVRIIVGAGGVGKTRLALMVASEWESRGHEWRRVAAGHEGEAVAAARGVTSGPVLLLVDYAETRTGLEAMLDAVLTDAGTIRVLMLARSLGEWWERLIEKSASAVARLLTDAEPIRLADQITRDFSDADLVVAAIPQFARALQVAAPERVEVELPASHVPVLVLHTAALVAVLRFRDDPAASLRAVVADGALDELLEHEARYWRRKAAAAGLQDDGAVLKPVVAVAALLGAGSLAEAAEAVARVPDLSDASQAQRRSWARWLYELYPASPDGRLGSLQPDLLAETHVVRQLAHAPDLAQASLTDLPGGQAEHALTVLARAWAHHDAAERIIAGALRADIARLALPAAQVALQTRGGLGALLADALEEAPVPQDALIRIAEALPYPSVVLAEALLAVTSRVLGSLSSDAEPAVVAKWNERAGLALAQAGRSAEALTVTGKAAAIYRDLADADPRRYLPDLAISLDALGTRLYDLGQTAEALTATEKALAILRGLADADPARYRPDLAAVLSNLGVRLWALGRFEEALPLAEDAAATFRELAKADPGHYRSYLARSLTNLGIWRAELGRFADAVPVIEEAAVIYRELAAADPDRYNPDLAQILVNLEVTLAALGRTSDALPIAEDAAALYRELAGANPGRHRPGLAACLSNLGIRLAELERYADAFPIAGEAAAIFRELAEANPDRYRPGLAAALANLGVRYSDLGQLTGALPITEEATNLYRELAEASPDRYRPELAASLSNLGLRLSELGRSADALPFARQAAASFRELTDANPNRYRPDLARSLYNLADILSRLDHHPEADQARREADALPREAP